MLKYSYKCDFCDREFEVFRTCLGHLEKQLGSIHTDYPAASLTYSIEELLNMNWLGVYTADNTWITNIQSTREIVQNFVSNKK